MTGKSMDPFGSMQNMLGKFQQFMGNPMQFMAQNRLNLPQNINPMQDPSTAIQHLMNTGVMSQEQYNQLNNIAKQIQGNSMFQRMFMK